MALKTGWTYDYIESLPAEIITELEALNTWRPWTDEAVQHQLGTIATLIVNTTSGMKKQHMKSPTDFFPWLKTGIPSHFEDERVSKAQSLLESVNQIPNEEFATKQRNVMQEKIQEEIDLESNSSDPDFYVIRRLTDLLRGD